MNHSHKIYKQNYTEPQIPSLKYQKQRLPYSQPYNSSSDSGLSFRLQIRTRTTKLGKNFLNIDSTNPTSPITYPHKKKKNQFFFSKETSKKNHTPSSLPIQKPQILKQSNLTHTKLKKGVIAKNTKKHRKKQRKKKLGRTMIQVLMGRN